MSEVRSLSLSTVIAGLDPAIQSMSATARRFVDLLDCRVKPGNDG